ncbi:flagellar cap protein FliD N-terminal domain-containing protein, partial [Bacillus sp. D-CC]
FTTFKVDPTIISLSYVAIGLVVVISIFIAVRNHSKHSNTPTAGYPNDQKQMLTNEKNVYASMKKEFDSFTQLFKDLSAFKGEEKKTTISKEGFIIAQADASAISGTYNITVQKIAERHQITTTPINSSNSGDQYKKIELDAKIETDDTFKINGVVVI